MAFLGQLLQVSQLFLLGLGGFLIEFVQGGKAQHILATGAYFGARNLVVVEGLDSVVDAVLGEQIRG